VILLSDTDFLSSFLKIGQLEAVRDFYRTEHLFTASGVYQELSRTDLVTYDCPALGLGLVEPADG
jgi:hypothetical protein